MIDYGLEGGVPMEPLETNIESDVVSVGPYLPRVKMNYQLYQATANRLAMQLMVAVGDSYKTNMSGWKDAEEPEVQFLRHIRNAAAHNNQIKFESPEDPRENTHWEGFSLTREMEGRQVFPDFSKIIVGTETVEFEEGFFEAGDAFSLASDVLAILVERSDYTHDDIRDPLDTQ